MREVRSWTELAKELGPGSHPLVRRAMHPSDRAQDFPLPGQANAQNASIKIGKAITQQGPEYPLRPLSPTPSQRAAVFDPSCSGKSIAGFLTALHACRPGVPVTILDTQEGSDPDV